VKHTPGPWTELDNTGDIIIADRPGEGMFTIASLENQSPRGDEKCANARLIAAAPELLEALKGVFAELACHDGARPICWTCDAVVAARAAIAKAEG
jgi:hypothetical protein